MSPDSAPPSKASSELQSLVNPSRSSGDREGTISSPDDRDNWHRYWRLITAVVVISLGAAVITAFWGRSFFLTPRQRYEFWTRAKSEGLSYTVYRYRFNTIEACRESEKKQDHRLVLNGFGCDDPAATRDRLSRGCNHLETVKCEMLKYLDSQEDPL